MVDEHVPAWKRLGLKVQESDTGVIKPQVSAQKRKELDDVEQSEKKAPKRKKLPKSERPPPPESDQLAYLRQYHEDKSSWKFSKQKQNWILKNALNTDLVPVVYDDALGSYIDGLQGDKARTRLQDQANDIIRNWNEFMLKNDDQSKKNDAESAASPSAADKAEEGDQATKTRKEIMKEQRVMQEQEKQNKAPEEVQATRARNVYKWITGENVKLELVDEFIDDTDDLPLSESKTDSTGSGEEELKLDADSNKAEKKKDKSRKDKKDKSKGLTKKEKKKKRTSE